MFALNSATKTGSYSKRYTEEKIINGLNNYSQDFRISIVKVWFFSLTKDININE